MFSPHQTAWLAALMALLLSSLDGWPQPLQPDHLIIQGRTYRLSYLPASNPARSTATLNDGASAPGTALLLHQAKRTSGILYLGQQRYELELTSSSTNLTLLPPPPLEPEEGNDGVLPPGAKTTARSALAPAADSPPIVDTNNPTIVDIMVLYTPAAISTAGGLSNMLAKIDLAIAEANQAYIDSGVAVRLNLVHAAQENYSESTSLSTDLGRIYNASDGYMDDIPSLRNQYKADVVTLLVGPGDAKYAGMGYILTDNIDTSAFNVVQAQYVVGYWVLAHEVGHNFGCAHDRANAVGSAAAFPYSYGYNFTYNGSTYGTVMSYPGIRLGMFSTPLRTYEGVPVGTATNDNALTINQRASFIASLQTAPTYHVSISLNGTGTLSTNSVTISPGVLTIGRGQNLNLSASGNFICWTGATNTADSSIQYPVTEDTELAANFADGSSSFAPVVTTQPQGNDLAPGDSYTLQADGVGLPVPTFQWQKNGTSCGSGKTYTISDASASDQANYQCVLANSAGSVTSSIATVWVGQPASITTQPSSQTAILGSSVAFHVAASISTVSYQWYFAGNALSGATNATLTLSGLSTNNNGSYYAIVTAGGIPIQSGTALLTVVQGKPTILTPTATATNTILAGQRLTMSVQCAGGNLSYTWKKGATVLSGSTNSQTNSVFTINSATTNDTGTYTCTAANSSGSSNATFQVFVVGPPGLTANLPPKAYVALGSNITLSVSAAGLYLHYNWSANGTPLPGNDTNKLLLSGVTTNAAGLYTVGISNQCGTVQSSNCTLAVELYPAITSQPVSTNILGTNSPLTLCVTATGDNCFYQWLKGGSPFKSGANSTNLLWTSLSTTDSATYSVVVSNHVGKATSSNAVVIVVSGPKITTQPAGKGLAVGTNYTLTVAASGSYLHYYWGHNGTNLSGNDTNRLSFTSIQTSNAGLYSVLVSNLAGSVSSSNVLITVQAPPAITSQPGSEQIKLGGTISLSVGATGDSLVYLWSKDGKLLSSGSNSSLTLTNAKLSDSGKYLVTLSNTVSVIQSTSATVTVVAPPVLASTAKSTSILQGASNTLKVTATGTGPIAYQWSFCGTNTPRATNDIAQATNATYLLAAMSAASVGTYFLTASNFGGTSTTNIIVTLLLDTKAPSLTLSGASSAFTNAVVHLTGQAADNVAVSNVCFSLDLGTHFTNATTTNGWTNFVVNTTLPRPGTNTLLLKAVDINGNWTSPLTNRLLLAPLYSISLAIAGNGTVLSNWTGKAQWGKNCTLTARPGNNYVFGAWSGSWATNSPSLSFSPTNDLALTATFVTNLFIGCEGLYNGLFSSTNAGTDLLQSGGYLTLNVTTNQTYSGKVFAQGQSASLSGSFATDGSLTKTLLLTNTQALTLALSLDFTNRQLLGTAAGSNWTSQVQADLAVFSPKRPTTNAGTYTLLLPATVGLNQGYGAGVAVISTNGTITFSGVTADNTPLSQGTTLSKDGYWPLFVAMNPDTQKLNRSLLMGWLQFSNHTAGGTTVWVGQRTNHSPIDTTNDIESALFRLPAAGTHRLLTNHLALITFSGGGLQNSFSEIMSLATDGTVATDGSASLSLTTTGLITGSMVDPTTAKTNRLYGALLQNNPSILAKGSFLNSTNIGSFIITPYP